MATNPNEQAASLSQIIDKVCDAADEPRLSIADLVDALGNRSFGPLLLLPSLILVTPISGIPGAPTFGALVIVLVAGQMLLGSRQLWLPEFIRNRTLPAEKLRKGLAALKPAAGLIDRMVGRRLMFLTKRPFGLMLAALCIALALAMPPLEFVPMSSTILAAAVFLLALALTVQDGALALLAVLLTGGAIVLGLNILL